MRSVIGILVVLTASAQQPPPGYTAPPNPFAQTRQILAGEDKPKPAPAKPRATPARKQKAPTVITGEINGPLVIEPKQMLPPGARNALAMSQDWLNNTATPKFENGAVLYPYNHGVPTVVCAILHVCQIELQPGENFAKGAIDFGDNRFHLETRTAGKTSEPLNYLVVKPEQENLDTTVSVGTDRRTYYIRLISALNDYMPRVGFTYPDDEQREKAEHERMASEAHQRNLEHQEELAKLNTRKPIRNWSYTVKLHGRDSDFLRPVRIGDDGAHTHIELKESARFRGLPVVQLNDARGPIPTNDHWEGNELIVDAVFEKACLLSGVGRKQQRACIENQRIKGDS